MLTEKPRYRHPRESGGPVKKILYWIPAFAGMTSLLLLGPLIGNAQSPEAQKPQPVEQTQPAPPEDQPKANEPAKPQQPETKKDDKAAALSAEEKAAEAKAPKRFVPSQRTPADNSASFPVDI